MNASNSSETLKIIREMCKTRAISHLIPVNAKIRLVTPSFLPLTGTN
jgi:hypothetical protein